VLPAEWKHEKKESSDRPARISSALQWPVKPEDECRRSRTTLPGTAMRSGFRSAYAPVIPKSARGKSGRWG
jgi:hypothetical protein